MEHHTATHCATTQNNATTQISKNHTYMNHEQICRTSLSFQHGTIVQFHCDRQECVHQVTNLHSCIHCHMHVFLISHIPRRRWVPSPTGECQEKHKPTTKLPSQLRTQKTDCFHSKLRTIKERRKAYPPARSVSFRIFARCLALIARGVHRPFAQYPCTPFASSPAHLANTDAIAAKLHTHEKTSPTTPIFPLSLTVFPTLSPRLDVNRIYASH